MSSMARSGGSTGDPIDFTEDELRENYSYWEDRSASSKSFPIDPSAERAISTAPSTHTFGWRTGSIVELHKKILFTDAALRSASSRGSGGHLDPGHFVAKDAEEIGLADFVFAYLGVHDPYYAQTHFPAFGIFVRTSCEGFPSCNASRRDLASPEIDRSLPLRVQFLIPANARDLTVLQLAHDPRHHGKFSHYWGDPTLWHGAYAKTHWTWVPEFHFRDSVPVANFHAILWPRETMINPFKLGRVPMPHTADQSEFARRHPDATIVSYFPSTAKPGLSFVAASFAAAEHYLRTGAFPTIVS